MDQKSPQLEFHYIDSRPKLSALLKTLEPHPAVGLDTEFISEGHYEPALCLVQIAVDGELAIVDPIAIHDLSPLWKLLNERELVTVAARQEVRFAAKGGGAPPNKVLDLQIAAGLLGFGYPLSHTNLVLRVLGHKVHGGESFTDWRKRPLTQTQLKYAADDVRYLLAIREKLIAKAQEMDRLSWVEGECARLVKQVLREEERWRVSGSARLSRRQMAVLRELWRWRDRSAQQLNAPATRILGDSLLVEVARRSPKTVEDLFALRGLDRRSVRTAANDIVAAVCLALETPDSDLPRIERHDDPPQVAILAKLLSVAANGLASEYQVDPALLATTADLQELVRWHLRPDEAEKPILMEGWRGKILGEPLLGVLEGKRCVRVGRTRSANPLVFEKHVASPEK